MAATAEAVGSVAEAAGTVIAPSCAPLFAPEFVMGVVMAAVCGNELDALTLTSMTATCRAWRRVISDNWTAIVTHYTVVSEEVVRSDVSAAALAACVYRFCGRIHRIGGPAVEAPGEYREWRIYGLLHRDGDLPAVEDDRVRALRWYRNGKIHRDGDAPAVISPRIRRWFRRGKLHRDGDLPASYSSSGWEYYQQGILHRDDGPARINTWGRYVDWDGYTDPMKILEAEEGYHDRDDEWYHGDMHHRQGGPSIVSTDGSFSWHMYGSLHREDGGPARRTDDGIEEWYRYNRLHRAGGLPAILYPDGTGHVYVDGQWMGRWDGPT